jgi:hypothetical protein
MTRVSWKLSATDNDTGELEALNIAMITLPVDAVSFIVTDCI